jgi:hypothetical protein
VKKLPCKTCGDVALIRRDPELYQTAGSIHGPTLRYLCVRCGHLQTLTSPEFARLPRMLEAEIAAATCDISLPKLVG